MNHSMVHFMVSTSGLVCCEGSVHAIHKLSAVDTINIDD